jgi:uncharacterized protein YbjT (DUF2867 family)
MKIAIFGGSGLIGGKLVTILRQRGNDASPRPPARESTR